MYYNNNYAYGYFPLTLEKNDSSLQSSALSQFKSKFEIRLISFLENTLIDSLLIPSVMKGERLIDESDVIVTHISLKSASFFLHFQYLKVNKSFKQYFTDDGLLQLNSLLNSYQVNCKCFSCKETFLLKENMKVCSVCHEKFHLTCSKSNNSKSLWKCKSG